MKLTTLFTENLGLKLLALALAIVVYHALKTDSASNTERNDRHLFQHP